MEGSVHAAGAGSIGGTGVCPGGYQHAVVTGQDGEHGAHQEAQGGHPVLKADTDAHDQDGDEPDEDLVFSTEEGGSALCNGGTDLVDGFRAVRGVENLILFVPGHQERNNCGNRGSKDQDVHKPCFLSVCK